MFCRFYMAWRQLWESLKLLDNLQRVQKRFLEHFRANPVGQGSNSFVFNDSIDSTISTVLFVASRSKNNLGDFAKLGSIGFQSGNDFFVKGMSSMEIGGIVLML